MMMFRSPYCSFEIFIYLLGSYLQSRSVIMLTSVMMYSSTIGALALSGMPLLSTRTRSYPSSSTTWILEAANRGIARSIHHTSSIPVLQSRRRILKTKNNSVLSSSLLVLSMVQTRGMEIRTESATPTEGGMTLYCKAGPDGISIGDCPFCHSIRMVLEEKGLPYELRPCTMNTKPQWLMDYYEGKMPALRHRKECYIESDVIMEYLDFFFPQPPLQEVPQPVWIETQQSINGLFPAIAKYLKHIPDGDTIDLQLQQSLQMTLAQLDEHLQKYNPYLTGEQITLLDCTIVPKLYVLRIGLEAFKSHVIHIEQDYSALHRYMEFMFAQPSFQKTVYPMETGVWGWTHARTK